MFIIVKDKQVSESDGYGGYNTFTVQEVIEYANIDDVYLELEKADKLKQTYTVYEATKLKVKKTLSFQIDE